MLSLVSSLYSRCGSQMTLAEQDEALREAWRSHSDIQGLRLSAIRDDWTRQAVLNELARQHGARKKRGE